MNTVRCVLLAFAIANPAFAGNLDRLGEVDAIRVSPSDGRIEAKNAAAITFGVPDLIRTR